MDGIDALGLAAGSLTAASQLPQAVKAWRSQSVSDLSLNTLSLLAGGLALWIAFGLARGQIAIYLTNGVSLMVTIAVIAAKLRFDSWQGGA